MTKELIRPADIGRSKFILGKRQHTGLQTAATQRKRVFVSRLRPETDTAHLVRYIRETMCIDVIDCDKWFLVDVAKEAGLRFKDVILVERSSGVVY